MAEPISLIVEVDNENAFACREPWACTYNVFQNKTWSELFCAVPLDRPVPRFLTAEGWDFARSLHPGNVRPAGFNPQAAWFGASINGFYVFHMPTRGMYRPH
jgi:hypothetical protein